MQTPSCPQKPIRRDRDRGESGNILFLILITVALFAALSYVVSNVTRSGGGEGKRENISLRASQIIQYSTYTEQAVLRMRFRDIMPEDFCFDHDGWDHDDYYHAGCDNHKHHVFSSHPEAGGVVWTLPPFAANDGSPWYIAANVCVAGLGKDITDNCHSDGSGESEDIIMFLPNIDRAVCMEINKQLGIITPDGLPPQAGGNIYDNGRPYFTGSFADGGRVDSAGTDASLLRGQQYGCIEGNGNPPAGTYHYFHVLLPR